MVPQVEQVPKVKKKEKIYQNLVLIWNKIAIMIIIIIKIIIIIIIIIINNDNDTKNNLIITTIINSFNQ